MKLRKIYAICSLLFLSLASLSACSDDDDAVEKEFIVSKEELAFKKEGGTKNLAVKSSMSWTITSSETWCTLSMTAGEPGTKQFQVTVPENTDTDPREATLTITSGGETKTVKVTQGYSDLLAVVKADYDVEAGGETISVELQVSANPQVTINDFWITEAPASRAVSSKTLKFVISQNPSLIKREGNITLKVANETATITVNQAGVALTIAADKTGMDDDALVLAGKMTLGWNLGNSLEAYSNGEPSETAWGNPKTTKAMIDMVKAAGFNTVRIPCAWSGYIVDEATYKISDDWFARVKEVVDYCIDNDLYTMLNIHWDGGWLEENATSDKQEEVNKKQKALWEQIAVYFRDYDERLLFAGTNEVHSGSGNPDNYDVQMSYNQTFVDAVRSTGGRNTWRNLIVQAFATDIDRAYDHMVMSNDPTPKRLMIEVHYYSPWQFCGLEADADWGKMFYLWGVPYEQYASMVAGLSGRESTHSQEDYMQDEFNKIKTKFVDAGYPAILGEYGAMRRSSLTGDALKYHLESRAYYLKCATREAKNYGLVPVVWDNGAMTDGSMAIFNRQGLSVYDQQILDAIVEGAAEGVYPF